ncbi:hypothetical protein EMIHUDRAFT_223395 [Emiliania huxleyi CCMP1516]|uniref:Uncharacterized protein n=2 Tax=Emiliania huxleyi TaxID=2903 RepID=A0A0D3KVQ4_EMIH1|nr:hypothetical protein EMIHUDRAFT_223395 [Emiliania huxleyi CCMP1516]EOD39839.1 hypothetical protein EMIHUDRAFT_223395 [Emiliania huxleyi CCMP1516]|eukprot:XP_005792268.1 hypothetical protein EMIHUDRAFT_223395 [Emiliania huxleyi CCMP1516]
MADTPPRPRWPRRGGLDASPPRLTPRRSLAAGGEAALLREQLDALRDEADRLREENHALLKQRAAATPCSSAKVSASPFYRSSEPGGVDLYAPAGAETSAGSQKSSERETPRRSLLDEDVTNPELLRNLSSASLIPEAELLPPLLGSALVLEPRPFSS